jgi:hypothetical protein
MILKFWIHIFDETIKQTKTKQNKNIFIKKHDSQLVDAKQWQLTCRSGKCKFCKYSLKCEYSLFNFEMTQNWYSCKYKFGKFGVNLAYFASFCKFGKFSKKNLDCLVRKNTQFVHKTTLLIYIYKTCKTRETCPEHFEYSQNSWPLVKLKEVV